MGFFNYVRMKKDAIAKEIGQFKDKKVAQMKEEALQLKKKNVVEERVVAEQKRFSSQRDKMAQLQQERRQNTVIGKAIQEGKGRKQEPARKVGVFGGNTFSSGPSQSKIPVPMKNLLVGMSFNNQNNQPTKRKKQ